MAMVASKERGRPPRPPAAGETRLFGVDAGAIEVMPFVCQTKRLLTLCECTHTENGNMRIALPDYDCDNCRTKGDSRSAAFVPASLKPLGVQNFEFADPKNGGELRSNDCTGGLLSAFNARQTRYRQSNRIRDFGLGLVLVAARFAEGGLCHGIQCSYFKRNFQASNRFF